MSTLLLCCLLLLQQPALFEPDRSAAAAPCVQTSEQTDEQAMLCRLTGLVVSSGRVLSLSETVQERLLPPPPIAPGAPPLLSFRYFEGKQRHRFGKLDLVMDDAGH